MLVDRKLSGYKRRVACIMNVVDMKLDMQAHPKDSRLGCDRVQYNYNASDGFTVLEHRKACSTL